MDNKQKIKQKPKQIWLNEELIEKVEGDKFLSDIYQNNFTKKINFIVSKHYSKIQEIENKLLKGEDNE